MNFRADINGLRAIAVIAVVLFHFNPSWMLGGFAGVDVFFVISGFLMTGIIFTNMEQGNFSLLRFYIARANRIIPALAALCLALLIFGWFFLTPVDYEALGHHVFSSMIFVSNIIFWQESGYFDSASHEKWLLHTWSLSVEWQFYILYPLVLMLMRSFMSVKTMKFTILVGTIAAFIFCVVATQQLPNASYYLLPTRAWEMMVGGLAYLYPLAIREGKKKFVEWCGLLLIFSAYMLVSSEYVWPGYMAAIPVLGTFFIIHAHRSDSLITGNLVLQSLGRWSYSIYLWHWPIVVSISYFDLDESFIYVGILASVFMGWVSNRYIESIQWRNDFSGVFQCFKCKPLLLALMLSVLGYIVIINDGFLKLAPVDYQEIVAGTVPSSLREQCHIDSYRAPDDACEYFGGDVSWVAFGDSHSVELAYALAKKLEPKGIGLKHFSFSGCVPSYGKDDNFSKCARWYNDAVEYILQNDDLKNVVFNHRFTGTVFGGDADQYPVLAEIEVSDEDLSIVEKIDELIHLMASRKDNVYIFHPIPELPKPITKLIGDKLLNQGSIFDVMGTDVEWYRRRNSYFIRHFENSKYPDNVHVIKSEDAFCDSVNCYAVKDGVPLYFDDDHPSVLGASRLVDMMVILD